MSGRTARALALGALVPAITLAVATVSQAGAAATAARAHQPVTFHVQVGGMIPHHPKIDLQSFYPRLSVIHVGDWIEFDFRGLHTVSFVPANKPVPAPVIPAVGRYLPVNDAAGRPFWWGGVVRRLQLNAAVAVPTPRPYLPG